MLTGICLFGFVLLFLRFLLSYYRHRTSPLNEVPGPPLQSYFLGYIPERLRSSFFHNEAIWWRDASEKEGRTVPFISASLLFGYKVLFCLDPDVVKEILTSPASREPTRFRRNYAIVSEVTGWGLLTLEGQAWHRHRRIVQPSFHAKFAKDALNVSVPERVEKLVKAWKRAARGRTIDAASHMSALTLDIIGDVAFSHNFQALDVVESWADDPSLSELPKVADPLIASLEELTKSRLPILVAVCTGMPWMVNLLSPSFARLKRLVNEHVDKVIKNARTSTTSTTITGGGGGTTLQNEEKASSMTKKYKSLLQLLLDAKDQEAVSSSARGLSDVELRDELKTFMLAGHDTTSTWCHWALYALGTYPDIQQRVYADVCKHSTTDSDVDSESVEKMTYLDAFLNEVLRLYPPIGMMIRVTTREERWCGYTVPAGTNLNIPVLLLHRHPDHWPRPLEFLPERWLDNGDDDVAVKEARHPCSFLPFSTGGRNCIGKFFAHTEAKLIMSLLVRNFEIHLSDRIRGKELAFKNVVTLKSDPPVEITVKPR